MAESMRAPDSTMRRAISGELPVVEDVVVACLMWLYLRESCVSQPRTAVHRRAQERRRTAIPSRSKASSQD